MSALMLTVEALVAPGDRVVVVTPLWPNLVEIPKILSANVVCVPLEFTASRLDARCRPPARRAHAGYARADDQLAQQSDRVDHRSRGPAGDPRALPQTGHWIVADDVYERLVYDGERMRAVVPRPGRARRPRDQHQQLLEVVADDGLAAGLDRRAGSADAGPGQADRIQHVVFAGLRAASGRCGDHGRRTDDRPHAGALPRSARLSRARAGAAAANRSRAAARARCTRSFASTASPTAWRSASNSSREARLGLAPGSAFGPEGEGFVRWCFASSQRAPRRRRRPARASSCASGQETRVPTSSRSKPTMRP